MTSVSSFHSPCSLNSERNPLIYPRCSIWGRGVTKAPELSGPFGSNWCVFRSPSAVRPVLGHKFGLWGRNVEPVLTRRVSVFFSFAQSKMFFVEKCLPLRFPGLGAFPWRTRRKGGQCRALRPLFRLMSDETVELIRCMRTWRRRFVQIGLSDLDEKMKV